MKPSSKIIIFKRGIILKLGDSNSNIKSNTIIIFNNNSIRYKIFITSFQLIGSNFADQARKDQMLHHVIPILQPQQNMQFLMPSGPEMTYRE